jgi:hypothetical protein
MTPATFRRAVLAAIVVALIVLALRDLSRLGAALPWRTMDDFPDFYCAGWVLDRRENPYSYEPLHACEHRVNAGESFRGQLFQANPSVAVPAPQPAYDFVPFMGLARLPFAGARAIDAVAIVLVVTLCAVALTALDVSLVLSVAALLLSTAYVELNTGQIVPFALLALVLGGVALARRHDALAGICAALTAIEPTMGVPVVVATLVFVPRARAAVASSALGLAIVSLAVAGPATLALYFLQVLPAHAGSELHFPFQYSLTYAAAYVGLPADAARAAGVASYALMIFVGLVLGVRTSTALRRRELLIFVPALCSVIGGPFLHQEELCFAIPALLVLAVATRGRAKVIAAFALCLLAIPWIAVWGAKQLFLTSLLVCGVILLQLRIGLRAGLAFLGAVAILIYAFELHSPHLPVPSATARAYAAGDLVQSEWRDYTEGRATRDPLWFAIKLPSWVALLAALALAARYSRRSPPASATSPESLRETPRRSPA